MNALDKLHELEQRIEKIEERNKRVELDKGWETSMMRKIVVAILTYITIVLFFIVIKLENPMINALVPSLAFLLSTLSLPVIKDYWKNRYK
ncbi:hypothetical protein HY358_02215 [Candidatus Roizmanbacteria bacterium]|nr:hypothetical protein [Candidatus Roizmanbacteria bacterium]